MKTLTLVFALFICGQCMAQFCGGTGSSAVCAPDSSLTAPGITDFNSFPCITQSTAFSSSFQLYFPSSYGGFVTVDSVRIDSITNLPCGMCWSNNQASMVYAGGTRGCINITGTTTDSTGTYTLGLYGTVYAGNFVVSGSLSQYWSNFYVFVIAPGASCSHTVATQTRTACNGTTACQTSVSIKQLNASGGCSGSTVTLTTDTPYQTYTWVNNLDTFHSQTITVPQVGSFVSLTVTDTNHCVGYTYVSIYAGGPLTPPTVCYLTSDTSLPYPNVSVAFQKNDWYNNVTGYILSSYDTVYTNANVVSTLPSVTSVGYLTDTSLTYPYYLLMATDACGDTAYANTFPNVFAFSKLTIDTTGGHPNLTWPLQSPYNYSAIYVLGKVPGGNWKVKDTVYSNNVVSLTLQYTDLHPDSSLMEYVLAYQIAGSCDPNRSAGPIAFTNRAGTYIPPHTQPSSVIDLMDAPSISVYPNPAFDHLTVQVSKASAAETRIKVYDMVGHLLYDDVIGANGMAAIDISGYAKGIYVLKAFKANGQIVAVKKFTKE